jgi:hypothetical protein
MIRRCNNDRVVSTVVEIEMIGKEGDGKLIQQKIRYRSLASHQCIEQGSRQQSYEGYI